MPWVLLLTIITFSVVKLCQTRPLNISTYHDTQLSSLLWMVIHNVPWHTTKLLIVNCYTQLPHYQEVQSAIKEVYYGLTHPKSWYISQPVSGSVVLLSLDKGIVTGSCVPRVFAVRYKKFISTTTMQQSPLVNLDWIEHFPGPWYLSLECVPFFYYYTLLWCAQIIVYIMARLSYSFVCTLYCLIIIMQTFLKVLNF